MKILFDYQAFTMQSHGGVSRYFVNLAKEIFKTENKPKIFAPVHRNIFLSKLPSELIDGHYFKYFLPRTISLINSYNSFKLQKFLKNNQPDILHETYYKKKRYKNYKLPVVITVYDMIHELFRENFPTNDLTSKYKFESIKRADHIICISNNTKKDLIELYNIPSNKISVVYLASDFNINLDTQENKKLINNFKPFLLYVGQRNGYKNFNKFIKSFALSKKLMENFQIICFGGGKFTKNELSKINSLGYYEGQVIYLAGDDNTLANLYSLATSLVYPSMYEGFGLPLLEAMSIGCPVLCSNTSSLPEVAGNAAIYFDPNDTEDISSSIENFVFSESEKIKIQKLGFERCKKFSWSLCAQNTLKVYSDLIKY